MKAQPTRLHHFLSLLLLRTSRQVLWLSVLGLVGFGYSLLWQPSGVAFDFLSVAYRVYLGISLVIVGGLLGVMLSFWRR